jgi:hypothetical protein
LNAGLFADAARHAPEIDQRAGLVRAVDAADDSELQPLHLLLERAA